MLDEINVRLDTMEEKIDVLGDIAIETTKMRYRKEIISEDEESVSEP